MTDAAKPVVDDKTKPAKAGETDAEKKAADGAAEKLKADSVKEDPTKAAATTGDAKKTDAAQPSGDAKKTDATQPAGDAKKDEPAEAKNWAENALEEVRNYWFGIKAPDKSAQTAESKVTKPIFSTSKVEGLLDLSAPIAGYDAKKTAFTVGNLAATTDVSLVSKTPETLVAGKTPELTPEPAKNGGGLFGWVSDAASSVGDTVSNTWSWGKEKFTGLFSKADMALDEATTFDFNSYVKTMSTDSKWKISTDTTASGELEKIRLDAYDGSAKATVCGKERKYETDELISFWNPKTKESHMEDKKSGTTYDRLANGDQVIRTKDGTEYISHGKDKITITKDGVTTHMEGENIAQTFGPFKAFTEIGQEFKTAREARELLRNRTGAVHAENGTIIGSSNGTRFAMNKEGLAVVLNNDGGSYEFDTKTNRAVRRDKDGNVVSQGTVQELSREVKGLVLDPNGRGISFGGNERIRRDATTGEVVTERVAC